MKRLLYIFVIVFVLACDSEHAGDCFQNTGDIIQQEIEVPNFSKVLVNRNVVLVLKQGAEQQVIIETGKNLLNDVQVKVKDGKLILTDNNSCNYVRDYGVTKIYVTSPNITEIRSSTQYDVVSDGVLNYPNLTILSEDFNFPDSYNSGNFNLEINNLSLRVVFNNLSNCYVKGNTNNLSVTLASGTSRFEGGDLIAQNITFWNRSSNDMILHPQQSIKGKISGTGDVVLVNTPSVIDVEEQYKGRLIIN
ncbi:head GIN domain-containing protein [Gaetbulibacter saemankumensis]|uniref:head GIN domain-containing protein n=1 Tax=Gaetbulibacter saemankumensis TaxID=311208 RepID=UPI000424DEF1|nr:head GIN domain-containing protein [Gaetbulibacter saemankumensis]